MGAILPDALLRQSCDGWQLGLLDGHALRVAAYSFVTAEALGLDSETCQDIRIASAFHDIGKLMVPDEILTKPGLLNPEERIRVEAHTFYGHEILRGSSQAIMEKAALVALHHHEKVDGTGYPHSLMGEEIPLSARIVSVTDVFDALTTDRAYRAALPEAEALELLWQGCGTHFDEKVLYAFQESLYSYPDLGHKLRWFSEAYIAPNQHQSLSSYS